VSAARDEVVGRKVDLTMLWVLIAEIAILITAVGLIIEFMSSIAGWAAFAGVLFLGWAGGVLSSVFWERREERHTRSGQSSTSSR
jgi:uncharacterized membrane protein